MRSLGYILPVVLPMLVLTYSCRKDNPVNGGEENTNITVPSEVEWDGTKRADITYQLLVYSFADSDGDGIGDFKGIQQHLDYFDALGVNALWLSPVHPSASYHGYDGPLPFPARLDLAFRSEDHGHAILRSGASIQ